MRLLYRHDLLAMRYEQHRPSFNSPAMVHWPLPNKGPWRRPAPRLSAVAGPAQALFRGRVDMGLRNLLRPGAVSAGDGSHISPSGNATTAGLGLQ